MTAAADQVQFKPHSILILCRKQSLGADGNEEGKAFDKFIDFYLMKDDVVREKDDYRIPWLMLGLKNDWMVSSINAFQQGQQTPN